MLSEDPRVQARWLGLHSKFIVVDRKTGGSSREILFGKKQVRYKQRAAHRLYGCRAGGIATYAATLDRA